MLLHYNGQVASMTLDPRLFNPLSNGCQGAANPNLRVVADESLTGDIQGQQAKSGGGREGGAGN